jgi:3-hydroxyacyl-CoA dehydrogenase
MGTGIGIVASRYAGLNVTFVDPSDKSLVKCQQVINKWCENERKKERMTE